MPISAPLFRCSHGAWFGELLGPRPAAAASCRWSSCTGDTMRSNTSSTLSIPPSSACRAACAGGEQSSTSSFVWMNAWGRFGDGRGDSHIPLSSLQLAGSRPSAPPPPLQLRRRAVLQHGAPAGKAASGRARARRLYRQAGAAGPAAGVDAGVDGVGDAGAVEIGGGDAATQLRLPRPRLPHARLRRRRPAPRRPWACQRTRRRCGQCGRSRKGCPLLTGRCAAVRAPLCAPVSQRRHAPAEAAAIQPRRPQTRCTTRCYACRRPLRSTAAPHAAAAAAAAAAEKLASRWSGARRAAAAGKLARRWSGARRAAAAGKPSRQVTRRLCRRPRCWRGACSCWRWCAALDVSAADPSSTPRTPTSPGAPDS
eukprot:365293-Chlamydomonas_euryale.AAC.14